MRIPIMLLAALAMSPLHAQQSPPQPQSDASVEQIISALAPRPKTRALTRNLKVEQAQIDLTVNFDFDSSKLKEESKPQLERLAEALKNERLAELRFQVEGHTDAQGSAAYNEALSARRADAVVAFLAQSGVSPDKMQSAGRGFSELLDSADPKSARNRRVRIIALGAPQ